jgi:hypothetical protein
MTRSVVALWICACLIGCGRENTGQGGATGATTGTAFCSVLAAASTCQGAGPECQNVLTVDAAADSTCLAERDTFLNCLTGESLVCASSSLLYAGPDAATGESYTIGGYTVQTATACTELGDAWQSCLVCKDAFASAREAATSTFSDPGEPGCDSERDAFLACALPETATCPDSSTILAGGAEADARTFSELGGVTVHLTADCAAKADAWLSCGYCGHGLGYGKSGKDVGERCDDTTECADGLSCKLHHCTAPCDGDGLVCSGRTYQDGECRNGEGRTPQCGLQGACVTSCENNEDCTAIQSDGFCPGNGASLEPIDGVVQYGVCYFGPCGDWTCEATDPFPPHGGAD